jgi:uncharacterized membrane protein YeaQ/YmgE (transglycosylase-associated protein family)
MLPKYHFMQVNMLAKCNTPGVASTNILGSLVTAVVGAVVLLYIVSKVKKA